MLYLIKKKTYVELFYITITANSVFKKNLITNKEKSAYCNSFFSS